LSTRAGKRTRNHGRLTGIGGVVNFPSSLLCGDLAEELAEILDTELEVRFPIGEHELRIGEPVASARDLQRYERLLVEKRRELSSPLGETQSRVPAAGRLEGDLIEQANADEEAELQIRLHQTDGRLLRAIEEALARIRQGTYGVCVVCKQSISKARLEAVPWARHCRECKERERSAT